MVKQRRLGRTGLMVSEIGFGAWGIGGSSWGGPDDQSSIAALHKAFDSGINFVDTALVYGMGHSEKLISEVVRSRKQDVYIATKVPPKNMQWPARPGVPLGDAFPFKHFKKSVDESLKNLRRDYVDLVQFHVWRSEWTEGEDWRESVEWAKRKGK